MVLWYYNINLTAKTLYNRAKALLYYVFFCIIKTLYKNKIFKERRIDMFNSDLTKHLAELSKLEFTDEELEQMTADMTNIIAIMDKVCEFDTSKPAYALDAVDYKDLRADEHRNSYPTEEIVKNAKNVKNNSFVVPKVV